MSSAPISGDSRYTAVLAISRSGFTIYGSLHVNFSGGTGAWNLDGAGTGYSAHVAGKSSGGQWTYDFRNYTSRLVWADNNTVGSPGSYNVGAWVTMSDKGTAYPADEWITVPPNNPAAPSTPTVTGVSDTQTTVAWNRNATAAAPYASQQVQRCERLANGTWSAWVGVNTIGTTYSNAGAHSITDVTEANHEYKYRIKASNSAAEAYSGESASIFTTPAAPATLVAVKKPSGALEITLTHTVTFQAYTTKLQYSTNGGTSWTNLTTLATGVLSYVWTTPPAAASVVFMATITVNSAGSQGNGLTSGAKLSNTVPLTSPPNPPSALSPNGITLNRTIASTVTWVHNSVDSSAQTAYEFRSRKVGDVAWVTTGKVVSTVSQRVLAANYFALSAGYEWQVRTWGVHADPSEFSPTATVQTSVPPTVAITSPPATLPASLVTVTWTFTDPEGTAQSLWEARLTKDGNQLEFLSGSGSTASAAFTTRLNDLTTYRVEVRGRDGASLWSTWDQRTFFTDFPEPSIPVITVNWNNETGTTEVSVVNPATSPAVVENWIMRSIDNGLTWVHVATAPPNGTAFDREVPLGIANVLYKAIAWSALPSTSESGPKSISTVSERGYWGAGFPNATTLQMRLNQTNPPKIDLATGVNEKVLHWFAGRALPVETIGEARLVTGSVEFVVPSVHEMEMARAMALIQAPHLFRLPDGTTLYCSIGPVADTRLADGWYRITLGVTEVER